MAGRYVLLEFEDRDEAAAFLANKHMPEHLGFTIKAAFLKPKKFCDCPGKSRQNVKNWLKHPKYGLYICQVCKKPSIHHETGILGRLQYVFGYSILEK